MTTTDPNEITAAGGRAPAPWVRSGMPLAVSLALHALLLLATGLVAWRIAAPAPPPAPEVFIEFDAPGASATLPAAARPPGGSAGPRFRPAPAPGAAGPEPAAALDAALDALPSPDLRGLSTDPAPGAAGGLPAPALTTALAPPGAVDPLGAGLAAGGAETPDIRFAGLGTSNATSVVYVVDASGPMVTSLPLVLAEVQRSVNALSPSQRFGVVLSRRPLDAGDAGGNGGEGGGGEGAAGSAVERFTPTLVRATPEAKERLAQWLARVEPGGRSSPLQGLRAAIGLGPDAVFLLSRGIERSGGAVWDLGLDRTLEELDRLNPVDDRTGRRPILIKTIQFLREDPKGIMRAIGEAHGGADRDGAYTVIRRGDDLGGP